GAIKFLEYSKFGSEAIIAFPLFLPLGKVSPQVHFTRWDPTL
ncbi:unnamed protein product, partial [marine sediment metagenome]